MDLYETMRTRRSCRAYFADKKVPDDALNRIAEAINLAPTACNRQPVKVLFVRNPEMRAKIARGNFESWLKDAPVIAVVLGCEEKAWRRLEGDSIVNVDAAIMMEHLVLAATAEGLGTCWICAFDRAAMDKAAGVEAPWHTVAITPIGYAKENACRPFSRKDIQEVVQVID